MKSFNCKKACLYASAALKKVQRNSEQIAQFLPTLPAQEQSIIHIALVLDDLACKGEAIDELMNDIGEPGGEILTCGELVFDPICKASVAKNKSLEELNTADVIICCEKAASLSSLSLDAFCDIYNGPSYKGKTLLVITGFDAQFRSCANLSEKYLDYRCDVEEILDTMGLHSCSDRIIILSKAASGYFTSLSDSIDQSPGVRKKCQGQAEVLSEYIKETLQKRRSACSDTHIEQERRKQDTLADLIHEECASTSRQLGSERKKALSKLEQRFSSNKLKVREILTRTETEVNNTIVDILNAYLSAQEKLCPMQGRNMLEAASVLRFGESINDEELKKRHVQAAISTNSVRNIMRGGSKTVDTIGNAAKPVSVGKKFVFKQFRFVDKMSKVGGSETALNKGLSKVLGKHASTVSEKLGKAAIGAQKLTGSELFGPAIQAIDGLRILISLPAEFHNDDLNRQKKEELLQRMKTILKEYFASIQSLITGDTQLRVSELYNSYSMRDEDYEYAPLEKAVRELSQALAALNSL